MLGSDSMIDENKEISYFVYEMSYTVQVLDDGSYDDDDEEDDSDGV